MLATLLLYFQNGDRLKYWEGCQLRLKVNKQVIWRDGGLLSQHSTHPLVLWHLVGEKKSRKLTARDGRGDGGIIKSSEQELVHPTKVTQLVLRGQVKV